MYVCMYVWTNCSHDLNSMVSGIRKRAMALVESDYRTRDIFLNEHGVHGACSLCRSLAWDGGCMLRRHSQSGMVAARYTTIDLTWWPL